LANQKNILPLGHRRWSVPHPSSFKTISPCG
jgi:hypothetical protein